MEAPHPVYTNTDKEYILSEADYYEHIEEIGRLRYLAWKDVDGINKDFFAEGSWIDKFDKESHLWVIRYHKEIVASARLSLHSSIREIPWHEAIPPTALKLIRTPVASMNRLCVRPDFRGRGLTRPLDEIRIQTARLLNAKTILAEPVVKRFKTLEKYGFKYYGLFGSTAELPGVTLGFKMLNLE